MKILKKFFALSLFIFLPAFLMAKDAVFYGENFNIKLCYNDSAFPGDAVFVRMKLSQNSKAKKSQGGDFSKTQAKLQLFVNEKLTDSSNFYLLPDSSSKNTITFLTGIPLSSWWTENENFYLVVNFNFRGEKNYEFKLPFSLLHKDFVNETIPLNEENTQIKTDASPERMNQIKSLNEILGTINTENIFSTKAFVSPTTATRRTSFFADRRIYEYTNGKSSTSLHYGIDYGIPTGTSVNACADGKIVMAENRISTGWSVVIEHLPGLYSLYYHLDSLNVEKGQMVKQGELIGLSGATGLATGPHLHWEVRLNMSAVSPDFFTSDFTFSNQLD